MLVHQTNDQVGQSITALTNSDRGELIERWNLTYGQLPPKGISRRLLGRAISYEMQAKAYGGLTPELRLELLSYVAGKKSQKPTTSDLAFHSGTRLVREWNGRNHTVTVLDKGFEWNGGAYRSLSAVAFAITGARWSGPRFFGL